MKYAIIPADGHTGTHGVVYRSCSTMESARSVAKGYNASGPSKVQVVECALPKGSSISMRFVGGLYPRVPLVDRELEDSLQPAYDRP